MPPAGANRFERSFEGFFTAGDGGNGRAFRGEGEGDGLAKTPAGSGNEGDLVGQKLS